MYSNIYNFLTNKTKSGVLIFWLLLLNVSIASSQISNSTRSYEERLAVNIKGDFEMIGNTNMQCVTNCQNLTDWNNPNKIMGYVDVDSDTNTTNSSSATLNINPGETVKWAGLYWGGVSGSNFTGINAPVGNTNRDIVKLKLPNSSVYNTVTATTRNIESTYQTGWSTFMAFADVTAVVQNSGAGEYTVANIALDTGSAFTGPLGGWTLVVITESPLAPSKRVNVWDGFKFFGFGANDTFTVTGLYTPTSGQVQTSAGYFGMDGERNRSGDYIRINGSSLSNSMNPADNTLNGTISRFGVNQANRNPNFDYSWAIDIDVFDASGLVGNQATDLNVELGSSFEGIWGGVFVVSNEIAFPSLTKSFSPETIRVGETSTVTLTLDAPIGGVSLTNISITDNLPNGLVIADVPNINTSCGGNVTGNNAGASRFRSNNFNLTAGQSCTISFDVKATIPGALTNTIEKNDFTNQQKLEILNDASSTLTVFDISSQSTNVLCAGESTGSIDLNISGGTPPYTFLWSNGSTNEDLTNVGAGNYSVTVTDANGNSISENNTISEPSNPISINISKVDANTAQGCTNGTASADVSGGTPPYTYAWSASANNQNTANATNLPVGTHDITVTDANGCELTQSIVIVCVNTCDAELLIGNITNVLCVSESTGAGTVSASSNANPSATFTFTWSNGQVNAGVTSSSISNVPAGVYNVSVTIDGTVCQPVEETISISEPNNALNLNVTSTDELGPGTNDGTASATASGGVEPYTYLWSPGGETTASISGLAAGDYSVVVTDANGCITNAMVTVNPGSCNNLSISGTATPVVCNGESNGSVNASVANGIGPFIYSWDSLPNTTPNVSNLPAGDYTITVTDQTTLCTQSTTITINEPNALSTGIAATNILCRTDSTGFLDLTINGGTAPYTFLWNTGATTEDLSNVIAGTYSVTVTDDNGCTTVSQASVIEPDDIVSGTIAQTNNVDCIGNSTGDVIVEGSGGISPYSYSIDNGTTNQNTGVFENLSAGSYTILITDANGCTASVNASISEPNEVLSLNINTISDVLCSGDANGDITINVAGGTEPYTYVWSNSETSKDISNLTAGTYSVTVTDFNGCTISDSLEVSTITDNTNPTITCPDDVSINSDAGGCTTDLANVTLGTPTTDDNCSVATITNDAPATFPLGDTTVTWTVTDGSGNTATCTQTVTITDNIDPTFVDCAAPVSVNVDAGGCTTDLANVDLGTPTTDDNCTVATVTNDAPATFPLGDTTVTWTVTDGSGNTATCTQIVTITDNIDPTFVSCAAPVSVNVDTGGCTTELANVNLGTPTTDDNCSVANVTNDAPATFPLGDTTVTWTVTDGSGNTATCTQIVTITDNIDPTFVSCAAPVSVNVDTGGCTTELANVNLGTPTTDDNCSVASVTNDASATFPLGDTTVTWTVTDGSGNTATCTQIVTITDNIDPTFVSCAAPVSVNVDTGGCTTELANVNLGTPTTDDNCSVANVTNDAPATFPLGDTTVTWTVTDGSGNTATCTQIVTITDNIDPTFVSCAAPVSVNVDTGGCTTELANVNLGTPTTDDNCSVASVTNDAPATFPLGDTTVTWTVTDGSGNTATCTQIVTITDNIDPTFVSCAAPISVNVDTGGCTTELANVNLGTPTTDDNCSVASVTNDAPATFPLGDTTVTWTVTDGSGNTATCTQIVTITDNIDPTFVTCAAAVSVNVDAGGCTTDLTNVDLGTPTTDDNCTVASVTNDAPATFPLGDTTVTWTVTDGSGNTATCTQIVTITDNIDPTFVTCAAPVSVNVDTGGCTTDLANVNLGTPTTDDNCSVASVTNDAPATFPLGDTTVTWTVTDGSGNTATCTQIVTITDNIDPTFVSCAAPVSVNVDTGGCTTELANVNLGTPTTDDNCSVASVTNDAPATFQLGDTTVTWTVTDGSGNTVTCTQIVTITDNIDPTFVSCAAPVSVNVDTGGCTTDLANVNLGTPTTDDNCTVASVTNDAPATFPLGETTVTWTVTDGSGNTATCTQIVTITDNIDPTFVTCAAAVSVNVDTGGCTTEFANVNLGTPTTDDNCSVASVTNDAPATFPLGDTTVTWTVTDGSGNTATCTQIVTITDNIDPTFVTCAAPVSVNVDTGGCTTDLANVNLGTPTTDDNCSVASVTNDAPATFPLGDTTVTWTVTDGSGNTATCTQIVTITDNIDPTFVSCAAPVSVNVDTGGCTTELANVNLGTPTTDDNCSVASVTNDAPATFQLGDTTVTWTVTDGSGNTVTCTQIVTITDNIDPTFVSCAAPVSVNVDTGGCTTDLANVNLGTPTTDDNCTVVSVTNDAPATFPLGETTVTWTVTDGSGNTATCTQIVTITDNIDPTFVTCAAAVSVNVDTGGCTTEFANVNLGTPTTDDNCSVASVTNDAPATFPLGDTTVTWTVTDGSGNTATCTQIVTITDNIDPTFVSCAAPVSVNVDTGGCTTELANVNLGTPTTDDNCTVASVTNDAPATFPLGDTTVTWTVTDGSGNTATCSQIVTITDNIDPTFVSCAAPVSVNVDTGGCTTELANVNIGTPTTDDNCSVASVTNDAPATFPLGDTTVTWTVTDGSGNTATCTQIVTITDNIDPTFVSCAAPVSVNVDTGGCTTELANVNLGTPTTDDNCSVASVTNDAPATFPLGETTVTWTVTDGSGNTATCTQIVTITDNIDPTFVSCAAPVSVNVDAGGCTTELANVNIGTPTTDDNCSVASVTNDAPATFPLGDTTVTWTVTDGSGNTATCTQIVTITDNIDPTFVSCAAPVSVNVDTGGCTTELANVNLGTPTTDDNCTVASVTNDAPATFPLGDTTVTWTVTDGSGNTATCTQIVTITDNIDPTFVSCAAPVSVNVDAGGCTTELANVNIGTPTTDDNCSVASVTNDAPATFPLGDTTVTWTVTDGSGNTATCTQIVTITDNIDPTFVSCAAPVSVNVDTGGCTTELANVNLGTPTTDDNCSVASVTNDAPATFPLGDTTVTWTVTDGSGNTATCTQIVTITDNIDPTFVSCAAPVSVNVDAGGCTTELANVNIGTPTTDDNCSVASVTNDAPATFPLGDTTVTWTVTDGSGNTATCTQIVTITDNIDPTFVSCAAPVSVNVDTGGCTTELANVNLGTPTTDDNCSVASVTNDAPATFPLGETTVTWTVTDGSGNTATCTQIVTITDNIDPTFVSCAAPVSVNVDAGGCTTELANVNIGTPTTDDNCSVASVTNDAPATFPLGDTTVTWTVTDGSGNTATCTQIVTITDNIDPTFVSCAAPVSVNVDTGGCTTELANVNLGTPTTDDNCSVASVTNDAPATFPLGDTTVTWTVTDGSGNTATCTQIVTITDNIDPTFVSCAAPVSVNVDAGGCTTDLTNVDLGTPTTDDNCTVAKVTNDAPATFPLGDTTVTWTVTDGSGNTATCEQIVTITDNIDPTFVTCAAPVSVNVDAGGCTTDLTNVDLGTPTTDDNCTVATVTNDAPATFPLGDTTVTWTVTDGSGNTATCEQIVTITDNIDPVFVETLPEDSTFECDNVPDAETLTATDPCGDVEVVFTETRTDGSCVSNYTLERKWVATDSNGLTTTHIQTITVQDTTAPEPTTTIEASLAVNCENIPDVPIIEFTDNCSANVNIVFEETSSFEENNPSDYRITRIWTVSDDCDNAKTFTQIISVTLNDIMTTKNDRACTDDGTINLDDYLDSDESEGNWIVVEGSARLNDNIFDPENVVLGIYKFSYTVANNGCLNTIEVTLDIHDECIVLPCGKEDVIISKVITPNGDMYNEFFTITGVETCGFVVELQIFNRWGAKVYDNSNYQNDWNGYAHSSSVGQAEKVPNGTYFYIINLKNSGLEPFAKAFYVGTK